MDCFFVVLKCRVCEIFRTFRFSRFLHVSFFKSSTFRFAGFKLDALTHHLRSSWEILRADQPLKVLYGVLHGKDKSDNEALSNSVTTVLDKGAEIIQLAKEERRKYENG